MELGVDPFEVLRVVDYGDVETGPDLELNHERLQQAVTEVIGGSNARCPGGRSFPFAPRHARPGGLAWCGR